MEQSVEEFIELRVKPFVDGNFPVNFVVTVDGAVVYEKFYYSTFEVSKSVFNKLVTNEYSSIFIVFEKISPPPEPKTKLLRFKELGGPNYN